MDALALVLSVAAMIMFVFAASGRELRRFNEIALGLVLLTAALICQFTSVTNTHIVVSSRLPTIDHDTTGGSIQSAIGSPEPFLKR